LFCFAKLVAPGRKVEVSTIVVKWPFTIEVIVIRAGSSELVLDAMDEEADVNELDVLSKVEDALDDIDKLELVVLELVERDI